jgi:Protein of unknown function (DUF4242)
VGRRLTPLGAGATSPNWATAAPIWVVVADPTTHVALLPSSSSTTGPRHKEHTVPLYMDVHHLGDKVAFDDVAKAHAADLQTQDQYDVKYLRYWVDEDNGQSFCLVEAPSADAASTVHREAHGLVADELHLVREGS